jgi:hypothetical protein
MQWNDVCKKLLFEGYPICHAKPVGYDRWCGSGRVRITNPVGLISSTPAPDRPDEYSFDVQNIGGFVSCGPAEPHGGIEFGMKWSVVEDRFVFHELTPPPPVFDQHCFIGARTLHWDD